MRWLVPVLLASRAAFAEPPSATPPAAPPAAATPCCTETYAITARIGYTKTSYWRDGSAAGHTAAPELELAIIPSPHAWLGVYALHTRWSWEREYYGAYTTIPMDYTEAGLRIGYKLELPATFGLEIGAAAYREHEPDPLYSERRRYGAFLGGFLDMTFATFGAFSIVGDVHGEYGPAGSITVGGGLRWSQTTATAPRAPRPHAIGALRIGYGHFGSYSEDSDFQAWVPAPEVAIETPAGEVYATGLTFTDTVNDASVDEYHPMRVVVGGAGLRARWPIADRMTLSAGGGLLVAYVYDHTKDKTYIVPGLSGDFMARIRLFDVETTSIELFERVGVQVGAPGFLGASSLFGVGVTFAR